MTGTAATLDISSRALFKRAYFTTHVDANVDIDYALRQAAYDTLGEVVSGANGQADYSAQLDEVGNAGEHSLNMMNVQNQDIKTSAFQVRAYDDDFIMLRKPRPDKWNDIRFHQTWSECIPSMDVEDNHAH